MGMTQEDAIKWLDNLKNDLGNPHYERLWPYAQAIDGICELLEEQDKTIESLTKEKEALLLERIAELQHNINALHAAMQDTILVNNTLTQETMGVKTP